MLVAKRPWRWASRVASRPRLPRGAAAGAAPAARRGYGRRSTLTHLTPSPSLSPTEWGESFRQASVLTNSLGFPRSSSFLFLPLPSSLAGDRNQRARGLAGEAEQQDETEVCRKSPPALMRKKKNWSLHFPLSLSLSLFPGLRPRSRGKSRMAGAAVFACVLPGAFCESGD